MDDEANHAELISAADEAAKRLDIYTSTVALEGPDAAADAAREMVGALRHWTNAMVLVMAVTHGGYELSPRTNVSSQSIAEAAERSYESLDEFTCLCQGLLND